MNHLPFREYVWNTLMFVVLTISVLQFIFVSRLYMIALNNRDEMKLLRDMTTSNFNDTNKRLQSMESWIDAQVKKMSRNTMEQTNGYKTP